MKKLPNCPHCGQKITYLEAWSLRKKSEHVCQSCERVSSASLKPAIYKIATGTICISFVISFIALIFVRNCTAWPIFFVAVPFILFYLIAPFFVTIEGAEADEELYPNDSSRILN
ncbi:MAG: hypothetical protein LBJ95_00560 [Oscillospiraceae bacterium]|nr:hypothetical protein [Oscillospiraceae bacterium]